MTRLRARWETADDDVRRFARCVGIASLLALVLYVSMLWGFGVQPLRTAFRDASFSNFMRDLQGQYSRYLNRRYGTTPWILFAPLIQPVQPAAFSRYLRKGPTNWTGRYDAPPLDARGFKAFLKYVEMNAVRAELV